MHLEAVGSAWVAERDVFQGHGAAEAHQPVRAGSLENLLGVIKVLEDFL